MVVDVVADTTGGGYKCKVEIVDSECEGPVGQQVLSSQVKEALEVLMILTCVLCLLVSGLLLCLVTAGG